MHMLFKPYANSCFIVSYLYGLVVALTIMRSLLFAVDFHFQDEVFRVLANDLYSTMRKLFFWVCISVKPRHLHPWEETFILVEKPLPCAFLCYSPWLYSQHMLDHWIINLFDNSICIELKPWRRLSLMACVVTTLGPFFCIAQKAWD